MSVEEAAQAIVGWLQVLGARIATGFAKEGEAQHFRVTIFQVTVDAGSAELHTHRRVFEIAPLDIADCYEAREVAA